MVVTGSVGMGATEDTLSESPGEQRAGGDVAGHIERGMHYEGTPPRRLHVLPHDETSREGDEQSDQQEQQPRAARAQRVEPQRREQGDDRRLDEAPPDLPPVERPREGTRADDHVPAVPERR